MEEAYIGSLMDVPAMLSIVSGTPILAGRRRYVLAKSVNPLVFAPPHVRTAHSGSIPSLQIFLSSSVT